MVGNRKHDAFVLCTFVPAISRGGGVLCTLYFVLLCLQYREEEECWEELLRPEGQGGGLREG